MFQKYRRVRRDVIKWENEIESQRELIRKRKSKIKEYNKF